MSRPVVFLHGFLGAPSMWSAVQARVASSITKALLLPGHGDDPWFPPEPKDFLASVDALAASPAFSEPPVLVGYSMGARLALALALRHPEKIASAILVGVDAGIEDESMRTERRAWDDGWAQRARTESVDAFATAWENLPIFDTQKNLPEPVRADLREQRTRHTPAGIAWAMSALGLGRMPSFWDQLPASHVPITLVAGALDRKFVAKSRMIADRVHNARIVVAANAGHNVALEAPEVVAKEAQRRISE